MLIVLGIILFVLLVVVHEYGHFIAAKKNGVEVEEFGLGFPPRAKLLTERRGTAYTLNWLPIGGFVKLKGEHDAATGKGSFGAASFGTKALIIIAGVLVNWLTAVVIFTITALIGMPQLINNQFQVKSDARVVRQEVLVGSIEAGSPAHQAGLEPLDVIRQLDGVAIRTSDQLSQVTRARAGQTVHLTYQRGDTPQQVSLRLRSNPSQGALGIAPADNSLVRSTWSAPLVGVGTTVQLTAETYKGLGQALKNVVSGRGGEASQAVTGPVGIVVTLKALAQQGLVFVLFLIGVISLSLAVMNSLPIPALDGGRLFVMALLRILKKPLSKELEERIHGTGMVVLLALAALITVVDIRRFW